jgi:hypothetical protein
MFTYFSQRDLSSPLKDNWVEVLPEYMEDGILCAKENKCSIRIRDWTAFDFMIPKNMKGKTLTTSNEVVLDLEKLLLYPDLRGLSITTNFNLIEVRNTDVLYQLKKLETLSISSENINRFHIDISKIPTLKELVLDNHNPSLANIGKAKQLEVIVLYNYKSNDLREFEQLTELHDLRLYYSHIKSLDGIENFTKLEYLDIAWAKNLQDISALDKLEQVHKVSYINLPRKFKRK